MKLSSKISSCCTLLAVFAAFAAVHTQDTCSIKLDLGAAKLGTVVNIGSANNLSRIDMMNIKQSLLQHGVIVIRGQSMTRRQQVEFTSWFGQTVVLPPSMAGGDPEKGSPEIQRVTNRNYWPNGTWKGRGHSFGCYWHKDGDFQKNGYIASILYAEQLSKHAAPTMFLDNCHTNLSPSTLDTLSRAVFTVSVRGIPDFAKGSEEDLALFPRVKRHPGIYTHPENGRRCAYITSYLITDNVMDQELKVEAWDEVIASSEKYIHNWLPGDIVVWDNLGVMHRAGCVTTNSLSGNDPSPRILFRTQAFLA